MLILIIFALFGFYLFNYPGRDFGEIPFDDRPMLEALKIMGACLMLFSALGICFRIMFSIIPTDNADSLAIVSTVCTVTTTVLVNAAVWLNMRMREIGIAKQRYIRDLRGIVTKTKNGTATKVRLYKDNGSILINALSEDPLKCGDHIFVESALDSRTVIVRPMSKLSEANRANI